MNTRIGPSGPPAGILLATYAYEEIKTALLDGQFRAGMQLRPAVLAAELDVSKHPIMKALEKLAEDGLVKIRSQRGCYVATYTMRDVEDFFVMMFAGFEGAAAAAAADRRTPEQLDELAQVHQRIDALRDCESPLQRSRGYRRHNRRWHEVVHRMAHSPIVTDEARRLFDKSDFLIHTAGIPQPFATSLDERHHDHEKIFDALTRGDASMARREMEAHILGTIGIIHLERAGDKL